MADMVDRGADGEAREVRADRMAQAARDRRAARSELWMIVGVLLAAAALLGGSAPPADRCAAPARCVVVIVDGSPAKAR